MGTEVQARLRYPRREDDLTQENLHEGLNREAGVP